MKGPAAVGPGFMILTAEIVKKVLSKRKTRLHLDKLEAVGQNKPIRSLSWKKVRFCLEALTIGLALHYLPP